MESPVSTFLSFRLEYTPELLEADAGVSIFRLIARILLSRSRKYSLVAFRFCRLRVCLGGSMLRIEVPGSSLGVKVEAG